MKIVCDVLGVARSNVHVRVHRPTNWIDRRRHRRPRNDRALVAEISNEIAALPSYGYRRAWTMINRCRDGEGRRRVNHKRVYRVMRDYRLLLQRHSGRPVDTRSHDGRIAVNESNRRWCSDGFEIACDNRERVRIAFALDCCDREAMSWLATTGGISGDMVRDLMVEAVEARFQGRLPQQAIDARRSRRSCPRRRGNGATCISCAMRSIICRAKPTTIACRNCAGCTPGATWPRRSMISRLGSIAGKRSTRS